MTVSVAPYPSHLPMASAAGSQTNKPYRRRSSSVTRLRTCSNELPPALGCIESGGVTSCGSHGKRVADICGKDLGAELCAAAAKLKLPPPSCTTPPSWSSNRRQNCGTRRSCSSPCDQKVFSNCCSSPTSREAIFLPWEQKHHCRDPRLSLLTGTDSDLGFLAIVGSPVKLSPMKARSSSKVDVPGRPGGKLRLLPVQLPAAPKGEICEKPAGDVASKPTVVADEFDMSADERSTELIAKLLSPAVQVLEPAEVEDVACKLKPEEVAQVFVDHVPGVCNFLFRQQAGVYSLSFIVSAYKKGFAAFQKTPLHAHFTRLLRLVVHYGHENKPGASSYLKQVAEAFMDCQAVQARTVERVGLQIQGVTVDFQGLVVALVGEYKMLALKMLAAERIAKLQLPEDDNPVHYENRLIADLGPRLGLDAVEIRRAKLDEHAKSRFQCLKEAEQEAAAARCHELFDMDAFLGALAGEVNSFNADSSGQSLPRLFLNWASERLTQKHIVFDEDTCSRVEVERPFLTAILEDLFLGETRATVGETYRGESLRDLFVRPH